MIRLILLILFILPSIYGNAGTHPSLLKWSGLPTGTYFANPQAACKSLSELSSAYQHDVYEYMDCVQASPYEYRIKVRHKIYGTIIYPSSAFMNKFCKAVIDGSNPVIINNSTLYNDRNTCTDACNSPSVYNYDSATCSNPCVDGVLLDQGTYEPRSTALAPIACVNSCEGVFVGGSPFISCSLGSTGVGQCSYYQTGKYISTGKDCYGNTTPMASKSTPPRPENCPECDCLQQGKSYGTVNGSVVCTGTSNAETSNSEGTTTTDKDGLKSTTIKDVKLNPDGTVATTTTTTTEQPDGTSKTSTSSTSQSLGSYCSQFPADKLCKTASSGNGSGEGDGGTESTWSGSCDQSFQCDGDAVQCAISLNQHKLDCDNRKTDSTSELGKDLIEQVDDSENPLSDDESEEINLPTALTSQNLLPKGGLADVSISMGSSSVNLPFSKLNGGLNAIGVIVEIFAYLSGMFIVFGRRG